MHREKLNGVALGKCCSSSFPSAQWAPHLLPTALAWGDALAPPLLLPVALPCQAQTIQRSLLTATRLGPGNLSWKALKEVCANSGAVEDTERDWVVWLLEKDHFSLCDPTGPTIPIQSPPPTWPNLNLFSLINFTGLILMTP